MTKISRFALILAVMMMACPACTPEQQPDAGTDTEQTPGEETPGEEIPEVDNSAFEGMNHTVYTESDKVFPNPERGFYSVDDFSKATDNPIYPSTVSARRRLNRTVAYHGYFLTDFMESDISDEYLELIRKNMQVLRENGAKCVIRFAYSNVEPTIADKEPEDYKGRDASPEWVLRHIEQVKPILHEYADVIMCYQAGYVGVWGEWYYTDHFVSGPQTAEDYALRKKVVDAMLDALPVDRQIALRTPMFKNAMYTTTGDYTDTLTIKTAHDGSIRSRIGAFNDCFGASANDQGTFASTASREYWKRETKYTFMGGETCAMSTYCRCDASLKDMEDYHWTYLNSEYHSKVLGRWRTDGCMTEIERRLGYRFTLSDVFCSPKAAAGEEYRIALRIKNVGFSAPINPRAVELVLVDGNGVKTVYKQEDADPRFWFAGESVVLDTKLAIPAEASGKCTVYLNLPDPKETLHDNPCFSIRLANDDVWNEETGYNKVADFSL